MDFWKPKLSWKDGKCNREALVRSLINYQFSRTQSMFEYRGFDKERDPPILMLERFLQFCGNIALAERDGKLYAFFGGLGGEPDPYYNPTIFTVANPALAFSANMKIGEDCIWAWNDSMYQGLMPMFERYANALADNEMTMRLADIAMRAPFLIAAGDDDSAKSANIFIKKLYDAELAIVADNTFISNSAGVRTLQGAQGNSSNYITQLIEYQQYLKASWFNEIGLNSNYNMKRESINSDEAQLNKDALLPLCEDMLQQRKLMCSKVNDMFGRNWSVEFASSWAVLQAEVGDPKKNKPEEGEKDDGTKETD